MKNPGSPENDIEELKETLLPSKQKMISLLEKLGLSKKKIDHSERVANVSLKIAEEVEKKERINADKKIVEAGALLHDIGLTRSYDDLSPEHSIIGGNLIRKLGLPDRVAKCSDVHEMISPRVAKELKFPRPLREDYTPQTLEEEIVVAADLFQYLVKEALEEFGYDEYNPWEEPEKIKESLSKYLKEVYEKKLGKKLTEDSEQIKSLKETGYKIVEEYTEYVKPEFVER
ncbi:hypothetical protein AKJ52_00430 [candidate division MSBL1 archaeon SCGC-AAA382C18]|uniref:HD/PDEase domain-containing protein n=1 Tax=candidate division MSBL1 archaeon SCGC-AAA382C18 TaxID=1698281 RepID=A0A133VLN5_9EURY|nr:hypothetical protein AKJ52_00430 [candidate division MSBL1 archaeon SCGC-AAA382C18]